MAGLAFGATSARPVAELARRDRFAAGDGAQGAAMTACAAGCGLSAMPGDIYCGPCASARDRYTWNSEDDPEVERRLAFAFRPHDPSAFRLAELAAEIPAGPWTHRRAEDGALILWAGDEPLATIYGGIDLAKYLEACAPARLLGDAS